MTFVNKRRLIEWVSASVESLDSTDAEMLLALFQLYFRRFRARFALIGVMIATISVTTGAVALLVEDVVNEFFVKQSAAIFVPLFFGLIFIFGARGAATYYQAVLSARISNEVVADIRKRMFGHVLRQRMRFFSRYSSDELLMKFNQGATGFSSILQTVLINATRDLAQVVALVAVMLWQDPFLALACFIVGPGVFIGIVALLKRVRSVMEAELAGYSELNKRVREMVQGITVIKSFNLESAANEGTREVVDGLKARADRIAVLQNAPIPLLDTAGGLAAGIALLYAGLRTATGDYDPGTFMSFLTALLLAADPARRLSQMRVSLRAALIMVKMVFDLLNEDDPEPRGANKLERFAFGRSNGGAPRPPAIEFDDVDFAYEPDAAVLAGLDLRIGSGEMVALVGPSGAGKSTVFKLLLRFYEPTSGTIRIDGADLAEIDAAALRGIVGYVGQTNFIFGGSIRDNLTLMDRDISQERIEQACDRVGIADFIATLPQGYETSVGELGALISGGQAQRLNLARAIIKDAPILLLDEVTSALDAENEQRIKRVISAMVGKKTIIVIAHRLSTVKEANRIALMRDGAVIDIGPHDELVRRNEYYERIVAMQFA